MMGDFLCMHVTGTDRADQSITPSLAQGERHEDMSTRATGADCQQPGFACGMRRIGKNMVPVAKHCLNFIN